MMLRKISFDNNKKSDISKMLIGQLKADCFQLFRCQSAQ